MLNLWEHVRLNLFCACTKMQEHDETCTSRGQNCQSMQFILHTFTLYTSHHRYTPHLYSTLRTTILHVTPPLHATPPLYTPHLHSTRHTSTLHATPPNRVHSPLVTVTACMQPCSLGALICLLQQSKPQGLFRLMLVNRHKSFKYITWNACNNYYRLHEPGPCLVR